MADEHYANGKSMKVYFIIPVYNESPNIPQLSVNLTQVLPHHEKYYIFVDDASSDDSIDKIREFFQRQNYEIIKKEKNYGPGHSFDIGFERVLTLAHDDDVIVTMEADNTSDIRILHKMIEISKLDFDLVLASVYAQGGGFSKTTWWRKILSFFANLVFRMFFNIKVLTLSSFYRVYKVDLIKRIKEKYGKIIKENGFTCMLELLIKAINVNATLIEVPMVLASNNRIGKSKMKIFKTSVSYFRLLLSSL